MNATIIPCENMCVSVEGFPQLTNLFCVLFPQYCEYMPDVAKCRQWLEKNFPNEFAKLTVGKKISVLFLM